MASSRRRNFSEYERADVVTGDGSERAVDLALRAWPLLLQHDDDGLDRRTTGLGAGELGDHDGRILGERVQLAHPATHFANLRRLAGIAPGRFDSQHRRPLRSLRPWSDRGRRW